MEERGQHVDDARLGKWLQPVSKPDSYFSVSMASGGHNAQSKLWNGFRAWADLSIGLLELGTQISVQPNREIVLNGTLAHGDTWSQGPRWFLSNRTLYRNHGAFTMALAITDICLWNACSAIEKNAQRALGCSSAL